MKHLIARSFALVIAAAPALAGVEILLSDNGGSATVDVIPRLLSLGHNVTVSNPGTWGSSFDYSAYDVVAFEFGSPSP